MTSKRSHEGYLLLDNRAGPGVSDEFSQKAGLPPGAGKNLFECATITCSHCQQVLIVNPLRNRERAYCPKCDHYICDRCGALRALNGGQCKTFRQIIEETQEQAVRAEQAGVSPGGIILP